MLHTGHMALERVKALAQGNIRVKSVMWKTHENCIIMINMFRVVG